MEIQSNQLKDKLLFPRGLLTLLNDTNLFGPLVEKAIEDIDFLIELSETGGERSKSASMR